MGVGIDSEKSYAPFVSSLPIQSPVDSVEEQPTEGWDEHGVHEVV